MESKYTVGIYGLHYHPSDPFLFLGFSAIPILCLKVFFNHSSYYHYYYYYCFHWSIQENQLILWGKKNYTAVLLTLLIMSVTYFSLHIFLSTHTYNNNINAGKLQPVGLGPDTYTYIYNYKRYIKLKLNLLNRHLKLVEYNPPRQVVPTVTHSSTK